MHGNLSAIFTHRLFVIRVDVVVRFVGCVRTHEDDLVESFISMHLRNCMRARERRFATADSLELSSDAVSLSDNPFV